MAKKRLTILLGAGAANPWNGPTTASITENLIASFNKENEINLLCRIQSILAKYHGRTNQSEINFEILIYALELLWEYYFNKEQQNPMEVRPDFPGLFNVIEEIDSIIKPQERNSENSLSSQKKNTIEDYLRKCIEIIKKIVSKYKANFKDTSYYANEEVKEMIKRLRTKYILRVYPLNYDSSLIDLDLGFYNGFEGEDTTSNYGKIINERNTDCFYNLHGCVDWDYCIDDLAANGYSYKYLGSRTVPHSNFGVKPIRRRTIFFSPIITGQQKYLHALVRPFNVFFHSFRQDCANSDKILTIGYSYSDDHINDCIAAAMAESLEDDQKATTQFLNVTYMKKSDDNSAFSQFKFTYGFVSGMNGVSKKVVSNEWKDGFGDFLKNEQWNQLL